MEMTTTTRPRRYTPNVDLDWDLIRALDAHGFDILVDGTQVAVYHRRSRSTSEYVPAAEFDDLAEQVLEPLI